MYMYIIKQAVRKLFNDNEICLIKPDDCHLKPESCADQVTDQKTEP